MVRYCLNMAKNEWEYAVTVEIGRNLVAERRRQGLTAEQLAAATEQAGLKIPRQVISNLENGRRDSIGVAELLVFARALKVAPVSLLFAPDRLNAPFPSAEPDGAADVAHSNYEAYESFLGLGAFDRLAGAGEVPAYRLYGDLSRLHSDLLGTLAQLETAKSQLAGLIERAGDEATDDDLIEERGRVELRIDVAEMQIQQQLNEAGTTMHKLYTLNPDNLPASVDKLKKIARVHNPLLLSWFRSVTGEPEALNEHGAGGER